MTHDWSHLDEHAHDALQETYEIDGDILSNKRECAVAVRNSVLDHLTLSDLAVLLAEKCPEWVAVPKQMTESMRRAANAIDGGVNHYTAVSAYLSIASSAPKLW